MPPRFAAIHRTVQRAAARTRKVAAPQFREFMIRDIKRSQLSKEQLPYLAFLFLLTFILGIAVLEMDGSTYYNTRAFRNPFLRDSEKPQGLPNIDSEDRIWQWMIDMWAPTVWGEGVNPGQANLVRANNFPLGYALFRQFRVRPTPCLRFKGEDATNAYAMPPHVRDTQIPDECFEEWTDSRGTTVSYTGSGAGSPRIVADENKKFATGTEKRIPVGRFIKGLMRNYDNPSLAYSAFIPFNLTLDEAVKAIEELRDTGMVDGATRLITVEAFTYSPTRQFFMYHTFFSEISASGFVWPSYDFQPFSFRYHDWETGWGITMFLLDCCMIIYIAYSIWRLVMIIMDNYHWTRSMGASIGGWEILTFCNIISLLVNYTYRVAVWVTSLQIGKDFYSRNAEESNRLLGGDTSFMFQTLLDYSEAYTSTYTLYAINALLGWFRLFHFFQYNDRMNALAKTIAVASGSMVGIALITAICTFAWACMGTVLFGWHVFSFRSIWDSAGWLVLVLVGIVEDYPDMLVVHPVLTSPYFISYCIVIWLILLNMVLAVVADAFADVQAATPAPDWSLSTMVKAARRTISRSVTPGPDVSLSHSMRNVASARALGNPLSRKDSVTSEDALKRTGATPEFQESASFMGSDMDDEAALLKSEPHHSERLPMSDRIGLLLTLREMVPEHSQTGDIRYLQPADVCKYAPEITDRELLYYFLNAGGEFGGKEATSEKQRDQVMEAGNRTTGETQVLLDSILEAYSPVMYQNVPRVDEVTLNNVMAETAKVQSIVDLRTQLRFLRDLSRMRTERIREALEMRSQFASVEGGTATAVHHFPALQYHTERPGARVQRSLVDVTAELLAMQRKMDTVLPRVTASSQKKTRQMNGLLQTEVDGLHAHVDTLSTGTTDTVAALRSLHKDVHTLTEMVVTLQEDLLPQTSTTAS